MKTLLLFGATGDLSRRMLLPSLFGLDADGRQGALRLLDLDLRAAMRELGRRVADNHLREIKGKSRNQRIETALRILKDLGGAATFEEGEGKYFIQGNGCPLAAVTGRHPEACLIAESLLSQIIGTPVKEHCIHGNTPSCRFEIR